MAKIRHGTLVAYQYHKCRCDTCKRKNVEYHSGYMQKNPRKNAEYCKRYRERIKALKFGNKGESHAA